MNHLSGETSPYLLQHVNNPVDWYPWCEDAFQRAKAENKPIFLSIGYSTCHWCHVMAHESFENEEIARILNEHFISIKVDREERPDIDSVYMQVCQAFTGNGGWPMSIFMTWDKKPFFAGTYFPPQAQNGQLGFAYVTAAVASRWKQKPEEIIKASEELVRILQNEQKKVSDMKEDTLLSDALQTFRKRYDAVDGGFGNAPKFPIPHELLLLLMQKDPEFIEMASKTLLQMRKGGIFDQIGYGFSRYSTDEKWLVPHFEKMLYDNALLIIAYITAYVRTSRSVFYDTAVKTAEYVLREMTSPEGGFYSAQDADSEGEEGKYYTFTFEEIRGILGSIRGEEYARIYDITEKGNYAGRNIPNLLKSQQIENDYENENRKLYVYRKSRMPLHLDDKILLSWNALMITAMAMLYRVTLDKKYLMAARRAQEFIEKNLCHGVYLYNSWRNNKHTKTGFLDDYAFYTTALIELYNSTLNAGYLERAGQICEEACKRFQDGEGFRLAKDEELFMNPKETYDGAIPSGNSVMLYNMVRLWQLTEKTEYQTAIEKQMHFMEKQAQGYPAGYCMFLIARELYKNPPIHVAAVLKKPAETLPFLANVIVVPESQEYPLLNHKNTYYVCKDHICRPGSNEL